MRSLKASFALAAFALALSFAPAARAQSDADKAAARQLATQGGQALAANKYAEALDLVTRAEAMFHAPTHLAMIARAQAGLGHYVAAREAYIKLSREELAASAPPAFRAAVDDARTQLPIVEAKIANLRIVVRGGEGKKITLKLDEQPVADALVGVYAPVDPGKHDVSISTGGAPVHASVELGAGERKDVTLEAPGAAEGAAPAPAPGFAPEAGASPGFFTPMRIAGVAIGTAGAAGVTVGVIFLSGYLSGKSDADKLFNGCNAGGCSAKQVSDVKSADQKVADKGTIAVIGLTAGGAALVTGVTLIVLGKPSAPAATTGSIRMRPYFAGDSAGLSGSF